jgi:adenosylmethionine-8-amino-7-oxononanoate aminotransferase
LTADDLVTRDLDAFWHPCTQMRDHQTLPPLPVVGAEGSRLYLADGGSLLDAISSWWCKSLGHGHPRLRAALAQQLDRFEHVIVAGLTHEPLVRLCERLLALANGELPDRWGPAAPPGRRPGHFARVFLADNGSTAVEIALKMALQAQAQRGQPGRTRFAAFVNGYHGETTGALSVSDLGLYGDPYRAMMFPVHKLGPLPYRSGPADPRWLDPEPEWSAMEAALAPIGDQLAAIIYEPILQGAGGMKLYSPALLARLAAWARAHGVYLIADEIAAGLGRLGAMLASHLVPGALGDTLPDLVVMSKGLTGGFLPLSAVLVTDEIYRRFDADHLERRAFLHSNTYTGNALGIAVALAALDAYAEEDVLAQVAHGGQLLRERLATLVEARPFLHDLRGAGMVVAVDLGAPDGTRLDPRRRTGYQVYAQALQRGALLRPLGDTMYLFPPLTTRASDLLTMIDVLEHSLDAVFAS